MCFFYPGQRYPTSWVFFAPTLAPNTTTYYICPITNSDRICLFSLNFLDEVYRALEKSRALLFCDSYFGFNETQTILRITNETQMNLKSFVVESEQIDLEPLQDTHLMWFKDLVQRGWGNGYVAVPPKHPLHGVHMERISVGTHFEISYTDYPSPHIALAHEINPRHWLIGFDTMHSGCTLENWPKERVVEETERLKFLLEKGLYEIVDRIE